MADNQADTSHENAIGWGILAVVLMALAWLLWYFKQYWIKSMIRWVRWSEMKLVAPFVDDDYAVTVQVGQGQTYQANFEHWLKIIPDIYTDCRDYNDPNAAAQLAACLNDDTMRVINQLSMEPLSWPFAIVISGLAVYALFRGPRAHFRRSLDIDGLMRAQSTTFPVITPFVEFNPSKQPPRPPGSPVPATLPPFAEALGPEEWLAYNQIPIPDGVINEDKARLAFAKQLGPRWRGPVKLPPYKQVLLAAFCLKAARKRADADDMLGRLALCWSLKKGLRIDKKLLRKARSVLKNQDISGSTLSEANQHAFENTALMRALATARMEGGVLAPAQFLWLRAYNRNLWYALNNLGRQSYHLEALGSMAHYKAEKLTLRPIPKPKVSEAIQSISEYMSSLRARPVPQLDYGGKPNGGVKKPKAAAG